MDREKKINEVVVDKKMKKDKFMSYVLDNIF